MENITGEQRRIFDTFKDRGVEVDVRWSEERGVASLLQGKLLPWASIAAAGGIIPAVLAEYGPLLGPPDVAENYRETEGKAGAQAGIYRPRAYQTFHGLPVYGATLLAFADEQRGVYRVQSSFWREVKPSGDVQIQEADLQPRLYEALRADPAAAEFEEDWKKLEERDPWRRENFPLLTPPRLYWHPVKEGFHPAYNLTAYQPVEWVGVDGSTRLAILPVEVMLDASTGEVIWSEPTREGMAYTDQVGDGLSTLQSGGSYITRTLNVVRDDGGNFFMINRLHTPHIRTTDAGGSETNLVTKLTNDGDLSQDADGHWNITTTSCTAADRRDAQQPETDGHFFAEEAWNFYHGLGWDGFDDGNYGKHCLVRVATHIGLDANAYFDKYTESLPGGGTKYHGYIAFYDGECAGGTVWCDFLAGDPIIFGHEYQHAITFFGAAKSTGEPGHLYGNDWLGGIREGFSDTFGSLRRGLYLNPPFFPDGAVHGGASWAGSACGTATTLNRRPFRRVEFPRSTDTHLGDWYCDHYADRNTTLTTACFSRKYFVSTILSHLAFLVGEGGVHQRASRPAEFIPVVGIGRDRVLEIFLYALTNYFDTIPTTLAGETLIEAGHLLLDAAEAVSGSNRTCEYVMMRRALYAVGLWPYDGAYNPQTYGGEACMLPWTISWRFSQPYLGFPALWYQSPDLFINNGSGVEYDAEVGSENLLFARVRNIGDQALNNIRVRFYFSPVGTGLPASIAGWHTCQDSLGADCVLDIASLNGGDENIANPASPPASQAVHWYLDPMYVVPGLDHFCLRARIECEAANHNNDCPYEVQSNISYSTDGATEGVQIGFLVAIWQDEAAPLELEVAHTLPRGYRVEYVGDIPLKEILLRYGKPQVVQWKVRPPLRGAKILQAPFDGRVMGRMEGELEGEFEGELSQVQVETRLAAPIRRPVVTLRGHLAGKVAGKISVSGQFVGRLELSTGALRGEFAGGVAERLGETIPDVALKVAGKLDPLRAVHFTQRVRGKPVGGVTLKLKT